LLKQGALRRSLVKFKNIQNQDLIPLLYSVVDKIIKHLKLSFKPERPPPPKALQQELLMAAGMNDYLTKPIDPKKLKEKLLKWGRFER